MKNAIIKEMLEWIYCIVIAIILAILVRYYLITPTIVQMPSMYPTLQENERLILGRWTRTVKGNLERGDIITFEAPSEDYVSYTQENLSNPIAKYEDNPEGLFDKFIYYVLEINKKSYIKRVIGLPGEHVKIENGKTYINGEELKEEYLQETVQTESLGGIYIDTTVPENCYFVMGDNRSASTDSRRFGCIPKEKIESKVLIRFWPLNKFGIIN